MAAEVHTEEQSHPGPLKYVAIAVVLAVITGAEVWVAYQPALRSALIPILVVMSAAKFALVAMFFMHLRFDSPLFTMFFVGGLILATAVLGALLALFLILMP